MTKRKIAISLPGPLVDRAQTAVRNGRARSISAYIASALEEKSKTDELEKLLEQMLAETGGPLSAAERDAADAALGMSNRQPRKRKHR